MKVRIGVGASDVGSDPKDVAGLLDGLEEHRFDSLWLAEILTGPGPDPLAGLAWAAARTERLKLGTTMLGVGRNPVRLAGALADVDRLSGGRLLLTLVPGLARGAERSAVGPLPAERGAVLDDLLPLLRRLWSGETVDHDGPAGRMEGVTLARLPQQDPLEPWLGGMVPAALVRCGRLADGWLPSACTPAEAAAGREVIDAEAEAVGRRIDPEHFGMSIGYARRPLTPTARDAVERRGRGHRAEELVPVGYAALRSMLEGFIEVGFSKFVVRPIDRDRTWNEELAELRAAVADLQT